MSDADADAAYQHGFVSALGAGGYAADSYHGTPAHDSYLSGWQDGTATLLGTQVIPRAAPPPVMPPPVMPPPVMPGPGEAIRLVIWDLDETFWDGTLEEGGHRSVARNVDIVRTLSARGIVNAIASKNHYARARDALQAIGIWDHFVLPRIAFQPKGELVRGIVETSQLRPASVLFIDDNQVNLNEVAHYNPGVQLAGPDILPGLLDDPRVQGGADPGLARLAQYKILEQRAADRTDHASDNTAFLRESRIRVSIHHDVMAEFTRVHDLVNRSNQLNFTKQRLPQDSGQAELALQVALGGYNVHAGYIKVADKYGYYGICGFYMQRHDRLEHFLFSCRALNMGVEQFVYHRIGRPPLQVVGDVVSDPQSPAAIDWITLTDDAESDPADARTAPPQTSQQSVCLRGGCDLSQTAHYLRAWHEVREEFPYYQGNWAINPQLSDWNALHAAQADPANAAVFAQPWYDPAVMQSDVFTGAADHYVFAFTTDPYVSRYRHIATGLVVPLVLPPFDMVDLTSLSHAEVSARTDPGMSAEAWQAFCAAYQCLGAFDYALVERNLTLLFDSLAHKRVAVILPASDWGYLQDINAINAQLIQVIRRVVQGRRVALIALDDMIEADQEVVELNHFRREVYQRLAHALRDTLAAPPPPPVPAEPPPRRRPPRGISPPPLLLAPKGAWGPMHHATAELVADHPQPIVRHRLQQKNGFGDMICFGAQARAVPDTRSVISAWVWLPQGFRGEEVSACVAGYGAEHILRADLRQRGRWQRIFSSCRVRAEEPAIFLAMILRGEAADTVFSAGWRLDSQGLDADPAPKVTAPPDFIPPDF